jgi:hypothetical protein
MSVFVIRLFVSDGTLTMGDKSLSLTRCFYDNDKWGFLYFGALVCPYENYSEKNDTFIRLIFTR